MASGFVQRWKGKATFDAASLWVAGQPLYGPGSAQTVGNLAAQSTVTITNGGITSIQATTQPVFARLPNPSVIGMEKTINILAGSSGAWVTLPSGGGFGGSTLSVFKSTQNVSVSLVGISSVSWAITGVVPTVGSTGNSALTLSTST